MKFFRKAWHRNKFESDLSATTLAVLDILLNRYAELFWKAIPAEDFKFTKNNKRTISLNENCFFAGLFTTTH